TASVSRRAHKCASPSQSHPKTQGITGRGQRCGSQLPTAISRPGSDSSGLAQIQASIGGKVLLNQAFTIERLQRTMTNQHFPIIHLSSHGTFSSDPKKTGIFAWNRQLDLPTLRQLVEQQGQQRSIELLVLSACETAKGDERSILGLAGVAAQAGARSTIASRWLVNEQSTITLMDAFYYGLKQGLSKAEALRQAKLQLIHSADFNHPFSGAVLRLLEVGCDDRGWINHLLR
ncbi:MAG: CHAT domain-containing protein, partial [Synechococcales cyanobacterium CRU_2_2]|nr:CHAT domain-containing protein [Synechococcales cyanobacterium CRU_2_2]